MANDRIWLSLATMNGRERDFVNEAFDTNWVAPLGPNVDGFECDLARYLGEGTEVAALSAGTAAIHLGLVLLGVGPGDEVICQSFTFAATANPITYLGATPVFIDSEPGTWNMSPELLEQALAERSAKGRLPKAVILVDLYGMPAQMDEIVDIASRYGVPVLEDAAEALGSEYKGRRCGTFGDMAALSFNGNKVITTSGGGALVSRNPEYVKRARFLATQARDAAPHYQHSAIGYNYRMSNVCAGVGRGQMLSLDDFVARRKAIHGLYIRLFAETPGIEVMHAPSPDFDSNYWLTCILTDDKTTGCSREDLRQGLEATNIESRPLWKPMHLQPIFAAAPAYVNGVSEGLFDMGLCLPSGAGLSDQDIIRVAETLKSLVRN